MCVCSRTVCVCELCNQVICLSEKSTPARTAVCDVCARTAVCVLCLQCVPCVRALRCVSNVCTHCECNRANERTAVSTSLRALRCVFVCARTAVCVVCARTAGCVVCARTAACVVCVCIVCACVCSRVCVCVCVICATELFA